MVFKTYVNTYVKSKIEKIVKNVTKDDKKKKLIKKKKFCTYSCCIFKVLKKIYPDGIGISSKAMVIMENFIRDVFEGLAKEAANLCKCDKKKMITSRHIQTAVKLLLPGELASHAVCAGFEAVKKYTQSE